MMRRRNCTAQENWRWLRQKHCARSDADVSRVKTGFPAIADALQCQVDKPIAAKGARAPRGMSVRCSVRMRSETRYA